MSGTNQTVLAGSNRTSKWKEPKLTAVPPLPLYLSLLYFHSFAVLWAESYNDR